jgi:hypothetical protein
MPASDDGHGSPLGSWALVACTQVASLKKRIPNNTGAVQPFSPRKPVLVRVQVSRTKPSPPAKTLGCYLRICRDDSLCQIREEHSCTNSPKRRRGSPNAATVAGATTVGWGPSPSIPSPNVCGFDWRRNDRARKAGNTLEAEHFASLARATCRPPATANRATADTSSHTLALSVRAGRDSCATHRCRCAARPNSMFGAPKRQQIFAGCVTYVWSPWKLVECDLARKEVTGACVGVRRRQGSPCREESGRQDLAGPHDQKKGRRKFQL